MELSVLTITIIYLPPTSSNLHPLQVKNCDSNSRLVVDEDYRYFITHPFTLKQLLFLPQIHVLARGLEIINL